MAERCSKCGNEVPDWTSGRCPICLRMKRDSVRYGDSRSGRTDKRQREPNKQRADPPVRRTLGSTTGIWKNSDGAVTLNFQEHVFEQQVSGCSRTRPLIVLADEGNDICLSVGTDLVRAWLDADGGLILKRKTTMKFRCYVDGKLHKLCPRCRHLSLSENPSCIACGDIWFDQPRGA